MGFEKAKREKLKGAIGLMGASGSGKTVGALLIAYGMVERAFPDLTDEERWEKIAFIDTEHRRSLVYVGMELGGIKIGEYMHMNLTEPFTVKRYADAVKDAAQIGAYVVVVDSISHAWEGSGGLLDLQQEKGGNFQAWREVNKPYKEFISSIVGERDNIHVISTMRLKQDYAMVTGDDGKLKVDKLGMKPIQRDSLEYEMQLVFNIDMNHVARVSKDNSGLFTGESHKLGPDIGHKLVDWLDTGVDVVAEREKQLDDMLEYLTESRKIYEAMNKDLQDMEKKAGMSINEMRLSKPAWLRLAFDKIRTKESEGDYESVQSDDGGQDNAERSV